MDAALRVKLAERGQRVLVLDKGAIGGGTSSKSSRLIHGGLRYLETRQFGLVREALSDRLELLGRYPELVSMRPFYLPIYRKSPRPVWRLWTGIKLYDALAGRHNIYRSRKISRKRFAREFPALKRDGIRAVLRYYDGKTNDLALTKRRGRRRARDGMRIPRRDRRSACRVGMKPRLKYQLAEQNTAATP